LATGLAGHQPDKNIQERKERRKNHAISKKVFTSIKGPLRKKAPSLEKKKAVSDS